MSSDTWTNNDISRRGGAVTMTFTAWVPCRVRAPASKTTRACGTAPSIAGAINRCHVSTLNRTGIVGERVM